MTGYISKYNNDNKVESNYDDDIIIMLYQSVLKDCFGLIENGYKNYLDDEEKTFSTDETQITAGICGHIETIIDSEKLPFDIVPEYFIYTEKIKKGILNPKKAKRFDLKITSWNKKNEKLKFGVEAKLLLESDYKTKKANTLIKEYIEDAGMGKFINNIYDKNAYNDGFMLGYILNGDIENIKDKINERITTTYSLNEHLVENENHYISKYVDDKIVKNLYHFFLDFSSLCN